jgi:hypothetical protein
MADRLGVPILSTNAGVFSPAHPMLLFLSLAPHHRTLSITYMFPSGFCATETNWSSLISALGAA